MQISLYYYIIILFLFTLIIIIMFVNGGFVNAPDVETSPKEKMNVCPISKKIEQLQSE